MNTRVLGQPVKASNTAPDPHLKQRLFLGSGGHNILEVEFRGKRTVRGGQLPTNVRGQAGADEEDDERRLACVAFKRVGKIAV